MDQKTPNLPPKRGRISEWFRRKSPLTKVILSVILIGILTSLFSERPLFAGGLIAVRKYGPLILLFAFFFLVLYKVVARKSKVLAGATIGVILTLAVVLPMFCGLKPWDLYGFLSSYARYQTLHRVDIASLPETDHEVMQPKVSIHTVAEQELQQSEQISPPHFVRIGSEYRWTMVKEPMPLMRYAKSRLSDGIKKVYSVPAEKSSLNFSGDNQSTTDFAIGETLLLGEETEVAVMRSLSLIDLFTTETAECRFLKDDKGEWVEVVPLIRWQGDGVWGFFFPQPEFGGVHVITQHEGHAHSVGDFFNRAFFGAGTTYTPNQMATMPYLRNQNLMPHAVKESIAHSFRFQNGLTAPVYFSHDGDTRIPEIDGGIGTLPVTAFFKMSGIVKGSEDMLYDYYGLEPYDTTKHGLVVSLFIPSDGRMTVYVHRHVDDIMAGISTVPGKATESMKQYDWKQSKVADIRPYNRKVNGKMKSFWLFSVVTKAQSSHGYVSSLNSQVGLADPVEQTVIWLDPDEPQKWLARLDSSTR